MKGYAVPLILILSVLLAVVLFRGSSEDEAGIDDLKTALSGVHQYLPQQSRISFRGQQFQQIRFLMAPDVLLSYEGQNDTALVVYKPTDSVLHAYVQQRRILWQHEDADFHYALISQQN